MLGPRLAAFVLTLALADLGPSGGGCGDSRRHEPRDASSGPTDAASAAGVCGTEDGSRYYGYYDGCNWCSCGELPGCSTRACSDAGTAFQPSDCNTVYYAIHGVTLEADETWVCDASGKLYRSSEAPAAVTPAVH